MSDGSREFTIVVPHLARSSPILLKSICAYAARHLSGVSDYDSSVAEDYHEQCIRLLIPALSEPDVTTDDTLLASLVILRLYEQMTGELICDLVLTQTHRSPPVPDTGKDDEHHLSGTSALVRSAMRNQVSVSRSGLQQTSFWGYLRQCLYVACVHRQPLKLDVSQHEIEMTLFTPPTGMMATVEVETAWCNWMTWILAEVVEYCFGEKTRNFDEAISAWKALLSKVEMWDANKPKSFLPVAINGRDPSKLRPFPEIYYGSDWHGEFCYHFCTRISFKICKRWQACTF